MKKEVRILFLFLVVFLALYHLPIHIEAVQSALVEAFALARWYAREHVILCLLPAFFISGAIAAFISRGAIVRLLGPDAPKAAAYGVASVSGSILAVCSCTVLPLFAGIYRMGAGIGPATAFLYSGPAINLLAIILTARILGWQLGLARAVGAVGFSVVIGLMMHLLFGREQRRESGEMPLEHEDGDNASPLREQAFLFASMVGILIFATWGPAPDATGLWQTLYNIKWWLTTAFAAGLGLLLVRMFGLPVWKLVAAAAATGAAGFAAPAIPEIAFGIGVAAFSLAIGSEPGTLRTWLQDTWRFARQILPLLLAGVLAAGFFLGRPGEAGIIPPDWVASLVGGNSLAANLFASVIGAFMYFATLTEVPILQGLIGSGMGQGPALALLLAGPALSLPNMLVIHSVLGTRKTAAFTLLVITLATLSGLVYGALIQLAQSG